MFPVGEDIKQTGVTGHAVRKVSVQPVAVEPSVIVPEASVAPALTAGDVPHEERKLAAIPFQGMPFRTRALL